MTHIDLRHFLPLDNPGQSPGSRHKAGDREKFKADLEYVINADPALLPDAMPENLFEQKFAEKLLANEDMLFE